MILAPGGAPVDGGPVIVFERLRGAGLLVERLIDDVSDLRGVRELAAEQHSQERSGGGHRKVSGSPAPWYEPAANLSTDVHAGARRLADRLAAAQGGRPRPRGSTDAGTLVALEEVVARCRRIEAWLRSPACLADWPGEELLERATSPVHRWARRCRQQLDELRPDEEPWTRAPGGLLCPNPWRPSQPEPDPRCDRPLWLAPGWAWEQQPAVWCLRCQDDQGEPYSWPHAAWLLAVESA